MPNFDQIPEQALAWIDAGKPAAIATVVETWGSAPRQAGSQIAICSDKSFAGSVSGGCVEGAVIETALETLEDGIPRIVEFGVSNDDAFAVGLACGGNIRILVEPINIGQGPTLEMLRELVAFRKARTPVAYIVETESWIRRLETSVMQTSSLSEYFSADKSGMLQETFVNIHNPPLRMIVVGAVHIAQPLLSMARLTGYDTVLVDPRVAFATRARFPDHRLVHDWPDAALAVEMLDRRVAVVTLSHDPKIDDPAIMAALESDVFYLGCLGSKKTHAKRIKRLLAAGFTEPQVQRIHGPVGSDIGAKSPAEIAVAIMAEITERLRKPVKRDHL